MGSKKIIVIFKNEKLNGNEYIDIADFESCPEERLLAAYSGENEIDVVLATTERVVYLKPFTEKNIKNKKYDIFSEEPIVFEMDDQTNIQYLFDEKTLTFIKGEKEKNFLMDPKFFGLF